MRAIDEVEEAIGVPPEIAAIRSAGFRLLLESDAPVPQAVWAEAVGLEVDVLRAMLERDDVRGRVRLDGDGRLLAIAGLSIEPTRHEICLQGVTRWTWCALDAVGIFGALEADGSVDSASPVGGVPIRIMFTAGVPDTDAVLFIADGYDGGSVVENWCPTINFFTNKEDAQAWVADRDLEGDIVPVADIASQAAEMWLPVVGIETPPPAG